MCDSTSMTVYLDKHILDVDHASNIHFVDVNCRGYNHDHQYAVIYTRYDQCLSKSEVCTRWKSR